MCFQAARIAVGFCSLQTTCEFQAYAAAPHLSHPSDASSTSSGDTHVTYLGWLSSILLMPYADSSAEESPTKRATGVPRFELGLSVLETDVLTVDTIPPKETMNDKRG